MFSAVCLHVAKNQDWNRKPKAPQLGRAYTCGESRILFLHVQKATTLATKCLTRRWARQNTHVADQNRSLFSTTGAICVFDNCCRENLKSKRLPRAPGQRSPACYFNHILHVRAEEWDSGPVVQQGVVVRGKGKVTEETKGEVVAAQIMSSQRRLVSCSKSVCDPEWERSQNAGLLTHFSLTLITLITVSI